MSIRQIFLAAVAALAIMGSPSVAWAGPFMVQIDPGGKAQISITYTGGGTVTLPVVDNSPFDDNPVAGILTIVVPNQKEAKKLRVVTSQGVTEFDGRLSGLFPFEPINLPTFTTSEDRILLAQIDLPSFTSGSDPFSVGQQFNVSEGQYVDEACRTTGLAGCGDVRGLTFRDATGFYGSFDLFDEFKDISFLDLETLPLYTGTAVVGPGASYGVPEPGSLLLVAVAVAALRLQGRHARGVQRQARLA